MEDHKGVQIRTQWDTGIQSCQMAVLRTDKQYFYCFSYCFYCFENNKDLKCIYYV